MDEAQLKIIQDHPIGDGLIAFYDLFRLTCEDNGIVSCSPDAVDRLDREGYETETLTL